MLNKHELSTLRAECLRYARALTRDPDLAEDLVQDILMAMLRLGVCGERSLAYAKRALYHRFVSHIRRCETRKRAEPIVAELCSASSYAWESSDPETVWGRPAGGELLDALEQLERESPHYGTVLRALAVDEKLVREVAEEMDIPLGTVLSRSHRARAAMRLRLEANIEVKVERRLADPAAPERRVRARAG